MIVVMIKTAATLTGLLKLMPVLLRPRPARADDSVIYGFDQLNALVNASTKTSTPLQGKRGYTHKISPEVTTGF